MIEPIDGLANLLTDVILPTLQTVLTSQKVQIAANDRLEQAIEELSLHLDSQFAHLAAQLTACRAELAALQAVLKAVQNGSRQPDRSTLIH